jgi:hypothetical protein
MTEDERKRRLRALLFMLYMENFTDGMMEVSNEYGLSSAIAEASKRAEAMLRDRLSLVDKAVKGYYEILERKAQELRAEGKSGPEIRASLEAEAIRLSDMKGQLIAEIETAKAKMDGAAALAEASGIPFKWMFPRIVPTDVEECPVCEEIRLGSPYTTEEARAEGFPDLPHPYCTHSWILVPA